jgi:hypothetical protein
VKKTHIWGLVGFVLGTVFGAKVKQILRKL